MLGFALLGSFAIALIAYGAFEFAGSVRARKQPRSLAPDPPSLVRVLRTEGEINEAVDRAIEFEQGVAHSVERRIASYHAARPPTALVTLPARGSGATSQEETLRSTSPGEQASA